MVFCFKPERPQIVRRNRPDINSGCRVFAVCIGSGCRLDDFRNRLHRRIHLLPLHEPTDLACPQSCLGQMWRYSLRRCPSPHIPVRVDRLLPVDDIFAVPGRGGLRQTRICGIGCRRKWALPGPTLSFRRSWSGWCPWRQRGIRVRALPSRWPICRRKYEIGRTAWRYWRNG